MRPTEVYIDHLFLASGLSLTDRPSASAHEAGTEGRSLEGEETFGGSETTTAIGVVGRAVNFLAA